MQMNPLSDIILLQTSVTFSKLFLIVRKWVSLRKLNLLVLILLFSISKAWAVTPPDISSFSPTSGTVGTTVTITGNNFNATAANNIVFFGAVRATVTAADPTSLSVTVPVGATYQNISVTDITSGLTAYSAKPFIITFGGNKAFYPTSFAAKVDFATADLVKPNSVSVIDLDGDGKPDLVTQNNNATISVFRNTSTTGIVSFAARFDYTLGINAQTLSIADFDGDGKPDLAAISYDDNTVSIVKNTSTVGTISFDLRVDYATGNAPSGISISDLDADGKPDIVVANGNNYTVSVLLNTSSIGTVSFAPRVDFEVGGFPSSISIGDLDGDGKPDIATTSYVFNTVSVLRNTSAVSVSFAAKVDFVTNNFPTNLSVGDLDDDDKPDLAVLDVYGSISVFKNTSSVGTVSFDAKVDYGIGVEPKIISIGDLDGDGKPDLAATSYLYDVVSLLKNTCSGGVISFDPKIDFPTGLYPQGLSIGDLDGDGKPDLVVANFESRTVSVFRNTIIPPPAITSFNPTSATFAETVTITGDNFIGITAVSFGGMPASSFTVVSPTKITAIVGTGATGSVSVTKPTEGTFSLAGFTYTTPPPPTIISFAPTSATFGETVTITGTNFTGVSAVSFGGTPASSFTVVSPTTITAVVGAAATGSVSVVKSTFGTSSLAGFTFVINPPTITSFIPTSAIAGKTVTITGTNLFATKTVSFGGTPVESFTIVSDTKVTAVVGAGSSGNVSVTSDGGTATQAGFNYVPLPVINSFSPASGAVGSTVTITGSNFNIIPANNIVFFGAVRATVTAAAFNSLSVTVPLGATYQNISVTNITSGLTAYSAQPFIITFAGSTTIDQTSFAAKQDFATGNSIFPNSVSMIDLDGDGKPDLVTQSNNTTISIFRNTSTIGTVSFATRFDYSLGIYTATLSIADFDGDGKPDLAAVSYDNNTVSIVKNTSVTGTLSFDPRVDYATGNRPSDISISDLDGNGKPDIVVANRNDHSVSVLLNTSSIGSVSFAPKVDFATVSFPQNLTIGDFDGDGKPDLAISDIFNNTVSVLRNTSAGSLSFDAKVDFATGNYPTSLSIGDLDGDGKPDLAVLNYSGNTISVLKNTSAIGTVSFDTKVDYGIGGQPQSLSIGDLDGDGKPDLAVTSYTSNAVSVLKNTCAGGTISFNTKVDFPTGLYPKKFSIGDLDGDGKPDLAVANYNGRSVSVLRNTVFPPPSITSFSPVSAAYSETVTITGDNFVGITAVSFGGTPASSFTVVSPTTITAVIGAGATGSVSITKSVVGTFSLAGFTFNIPTITSFNPVSATYEDMVTITGANFTGTTAVSFGGTPASSFTVVSPTTITAIVGTGSSGSVSVTIPALGTFSLAGFTFNTPPAATITSFMPESATYGDMVTITGTNFKGITEVSFGGTPASSFTVVSPTTITAVAGAGASGSVSVVKSIFGTSSLAGFTFVTNPPTIASFIPASAVVGQTVTITGTNLFAIKAVSFGGTPAESFTIVSDTKVTAVVGAGSSGNVSVTSDGGTATQAGFTYVPLPVITSFSPTSGAVGSTVTITGSNFNVTPANNIVFFGAVRATVTAVTPTSINVTVPDGATYKNISVTDIASGLTAYSAKPFIITFAGSTAFDPTSFAAKQDFAINYSASPNSVSMIDLDGDGKTDLVTQNNDGTISVFRNTSTIGTVSFAARLDYSIGIYAQTLSIADFDGDGKPDLAVTSYNDNTVSIVKNTSTVGTISFDTRLDYATGNKPYSISISDLDGDGKPDLAVANRNDNTVSVLLNNSSIGAVSFAPKVDFAAGSSLRDLAIGDFDGDDKPDIAVTNYVDDAVSVLRNTSAIGMVSFDTRMYFTTGDTPQSLSIGDLDGDGKLDLAVLNYFDGTVSVLKNTSAVGTVSFSTKVDYGIGDLPENLSIGDLDGDGKPDLASTSYSTNAVSVLKNTYAGGTISFNTKVDFPTGSYPVRFSIGDLDGDGKPDLAVANYNGRSVSVLRNTVIPPPAITSFNPTSATFGETVTITGSNFVGITAVSFGGTPASSFNVVSPTTITAVVGAGATGSVSITKSTAGTYSLAGFTFDIPQAPTITMFAPTSATFDETVTITGDHFTGVTAVNFGGTPASSFTIVSPTMITAVVGTGAIGSVSVVKSTIGTASLAGFTFVMNPPTITSFIPAGTITGKTVTITGTNLFTTKAVSFGGIAAESFTIVSATKVTAIVGTGSSGDVSITTDGGIATRAGFSYLSLPVITSFSPTSGAVGTTVTITGSNFNATPTNNIVYFGAVRATVTSATSNALSVTVPVGATYQNISVTDITSGLTAYSAKPFMITFTGSTAFDPTSFADKVDFATDIYVSPNSVSIIDLDGDGKPDLITQNTNGTVSVFRNTSTIGTVSFAARFDYTLGIYAEALSIADFDGDGKPDLAVIGYSDNTVSIIRNTSAAGTISFAPRVDYATGNAPYDISISDLDVDGKPDIAVTNGNDNTVSVLLNTSSIGTVSFAPKVDFAVGAYLGNISISDLDGDCKPDLAMINSVTVSVLRNTSAGSVSFAAKVNFTTANSPANLSIGDLDGDDKPDLAVLDVSGSISVLKNTSAVGTVSFGTKVDYGTAGQPQNISIGDLDGDGKPDLAATSYTNNAVSVLKNTCAGGAISFNTKVDFPTGLFPSGLSIGDLDGDGRSDLAVANINSRSVSVLRNIAIPPPFITSFSPVNATSGETVTITGDNFTGVTAVNFGGTPAYSFTIVSPTSINAVVGAGASGSVSITKSSVGTYSLPGFTFNMPPVPTITSFTPTSSTAGKTVTITGTNFIGTTAVNFGGTAAESFTVVSPISITAIVGAGASGNISIITAGGTATQAGFIFFPPPVITSFSPTSGPVGSTVVITGSNFNTTPDNNIVFFGAVRAMVTAATPNSLSVTVPPGATYRNISVTDVINGLTAYADQPFIITFAGTTAFSPSSFDTKMDFATSYYPTGISITDLNGDGKPDLAVANYGSNTISVLCNTGTSGTFSFAAKVNYTTGSGPINISIDDLDGDGKPDMVVTNYYSNTVSVFLNTGTGSSVSFAAKVDYATSTYPQSVSIRDLDGDGRPDIVLLNSGNNTVSVLRNTGTSGTISFAAKVDFPTGLYPRKVSIGDFDGDDKPDIAVINSTDNTISILKNTSTNGTVSFAAKVDFATGISPASLLIGDLDGDGNPDLVVYNADRTVSIHRNTCINGTISFDTKVDFPTVLYSASLSLGDLDGDGKPDLVLTNSIGNTVNVFKNTSTNGTVSFSAKVGFATGSSPRDVSIGDLDGDGKPDLVVTNYDDNTVSVLKNMAPTITSFTPTNAPTGTTVTITGMNFKGATAVNFGGTAAVSYTVVSATSITAIVGIGTSGIISVTTPSGVATLAGFNYLAPQTISFNPINTQIYGSDDFSPGATASSLLDVTYTSSNPAVASIVSGKIHITGVGSCIIYADQAGSNSFLPAPQFPQNLVVIPKEVTFSVTANKIYDGTLTAPLTGASLVGILSVDIANVTLTGPASGTFANTSVGTNKDVTFANYTISGPAAYNYSLTQPVLTGNISTRPITIDVTAQNKVYDGSNDATVAPSITSGLVSGDIITATASNARFDTKEVGNDKTVTADISIDGADAGNYMFNATASTTASIYANWVIVYPTLNQGMFSITITNPEVGMVTVRIFNTSGLTVKEIQFNKSSHDETFPVDMGATAAGLYMVEVSINGYRELKRIVIGL